VAMLSSTVGGYLAGRLRATWAGIHNDEIYFRDTAHGLLAWAFATILAATALGAATTHIMAGAAAGLAPAAATAAATSQPTDIYVDALLRTDAARELRELVGLRRLTNIARSVTAEIRALVRNQEFSTDNGNNQEALLAEAVRRMKANARREGQSGIKAVINATGVVLHTNLGRAPLSTAARAAMDEAALRERIRDGDTLAEVAKDKGKSVDALVTAIVAATTKRIDEAVAAGRITKAQRDEIVAGLKKRTTEIVNGDFPAFKGRGGPGFDGPGFRPRFGGGDFGPPPGDAGFEARPDAPPPAA